MKTTSPQTPVENLKNIGPKSAEWMRKVGIETFGDLENVGAVLAYKILRHHFKNINTLMLYSLYGALHDRHWNSLTEAEKRALKIAADEPMDLSFDQD